MGVSYLGGVHNPPYVQMPQYVQTPHTLSFKPMKPLSTLVTTAAA